MRRGRIPIPGTFEPGFKPDVIVDHPPTYLAGMPSEKVRLATMGDVRVIYAREPAGENGELLWHLSLSCADRHPTWDEIKTVRYRMLPLGLTFGLLLPPPDLYVNVPEQDHVFHLWEITDPRAPWTGG